MSLKYEPASTAANHESGAQEDAWPVPARAPSDADHTDDHADHESIADEHSDAAPSIAEGHNAGGHNLKAVEVLSFGEWHALAVSVSLNSRLEIHLLLLFFLTLEPRVE